MAPWARAGVIIAVVIVGCGLFRALGDSALFPWPDEWTDAVLKLTLWVVPCSYLMWVTCGTGREAAAALGLNDLAFRGYAFGLAASAPMLLVLLAGASLQRVPVAVLIGTIVIGPFAEEVLFRGWLFRQLWQRSGWPPALAIVLSAVAFGLAHAPTVTGVFNSPVSFSAVTSAAGAGVLFGWIVWRWDSLWPAIGLHTFMNLSWQLFGGPTLATAHTIDTTTAPGSFGRVATIAVAILLTLWTARRTRAKSPD